MKYCLGVVAALLCAGTVFAGGRKLSVTLPSADVTLLNPYAGLLDSVSVPSGADSRFMDYCAASGIKVFYAGEVSAGDLRTVPLARSKVLALSSVCSDKCSGLDASLSSSDANTVMKFFGFARSLAQTLHGQNGQMLVLTVSPESSDGLAGAFHGGSTNSFDVLKLGGWCAGGKPLPRLAGGRNVENAVLEVYAGDLASCLKTADSLGLSSVWLADVQSMTPEKWTLLYDWLKAGEAKR